MLSLSLDHAATRTRKDWVLLHNGVCTWRWMAHLLSRLVSNSLNIDKPNELPIQQYPSLYCRSWSCCGWPLLNSHTEFLIVGWVAVLMTTAIAARSSCTSGLRTQPFCICKASKSSNTKFQGQGGTSTSVCIKVSIELCSSLLSWPPSQPVKLDCGVGGGGGEMGALTPQTKPAEGQSYQFNFHWSAAPQM